jgi:Putative MetA-pathway of phenol degradation
MTKPLLALVAVVAVALPARAQDARSQVREIFHFGTCSSLICLSTGTGVHGTHFNPDAEAVGQVMVDFLSNALTTSISSMPLGATSSGTTFAFDAAGMPVATAQSTGPIFGERAQTLGRGRLLVSGKFTRSTFSSLRGVSLKNLQMTLTHQDEPPTGLGDPPLELDTIHVATSLDAGISVFALSATWGISNNVDIGFAVPIVDLSVSGTSIGTIVPVTGTIAHFWKGTITEPQLVDTARGSTKQTGIGDVSVRAKFNLVQSPIGGAAFLADVRLPTGKEENLLGTGKTSVITWFITSLTLKQFTPHANVGYLYRSGQDQNSAVLSTVGFDALISSPFTLAADVVGQFPVGTEKLTLPRPAVYLDGTVVPRTNIPNGTDNIVAASIGGKLLVGAGFTAVGNVLFPVSEGGMRPNATWTVGLERNF